jgi:hypothetical protein
MDILALSMKVVSGVVLAFWAFGIFEFLQQIRNSLKEITKLLENKRPDDIDKQ